MIICQLRSEGDMEEVLNMLVSMSLKPKSVLHIETPSIFLADVLLENLHTRLEKEKSTFLTKKLHINFVVSKDLLRLETFKSLPNVEDEDDLEADV